MSKPLSNLNKAGCLLRLIGWLTLIASFGIAASILIPSFHSGEAPEDLVFIIIILIMVFGISTMYLFVGSAIKKDKKWAKISGVIIALFSLLSVPIGTILGIFTLYYLHKGWHESPQIT